MSSATLPARPYNKTAAKMSKLHPQTKKLKPHQTITSPHLSCTIREHLRTTMTQRRLTYLLSWKCCRQSALFSVIRGFITFGVFLTPVRHFLCSCCTATSAHLRGQQLRQIVYRWQGDQHHEKFCIHVCSSSIIYESLLESEDFEFLMIVRVFF